MEKKITIKLFENFKNDIKISSERTIEIINYILNNYDESYNAKNEVIGDFKINTSASEIENIGEWVDYTIEIEAIYDDFLELLTFEMKLTNYGGYETRSQDQESPAEYADDKYEIELNNLYYSKYYNDKNKQDNDIDHLKLNDHVDEEIQEKLAKKFILNAI